VELSQVPQTKVVPAFTLKDKKEYPERKRRDQIRTFTSGQATVDAGKVVCILPRRADRRRAVIMNNNGFQTIYIGHKNDVSASSGYPLTGTPGFTSVLEIISGMEVWAFNPHATDPTSIGVHCEYLVDVE